MLGGLTKGRPQVILSASQDLSDEVLAKARAHCRILARLGYPGATDFVTDNTTEIAWRTGGRVVALPANPRTARSFTGDAWLDEYAYHVDPEGIRDAAFPIAARGDWRVRVFSTPNGAQGLFHGWASQVPQGWALHRVTVDEAIRQGLPLRLADLEALAGGDPRLFAQWFRCQFTDADAQYIPAALADRALRWTGEMPALEGAEIHAGFDVAREHDLSALAIVAVVDRRAWVLAVLTAKRSSFAAQKQMLARARQRFQWETLHVDATGLGTQLAEELVELYGADEVKPVMMTPLTKEDLATRAYRYLATDRLRLPRGAEGDRLHAEAIAVRRVVSKAGHVSYQSPRTADGHGDRWTALTLALKGAGEPPAVRGMGLQPILAVA